MYKYQYPVTLEDNEEGGYLLHFRDIPEINSEIWSLDELQKTAVDALITAADICFEKKISFPKPSEPKEGEKLISLPISVVSKILLHNAMLSANIRPSDLAKRMKTTPQEVCRIIDLKHTTKIDTIQNAFRSLGQDLDVFVTN